MSKVLSQANQELDGGLDTAKAYIRLLRARFYIQ